MSLPPNRQAPALVGETAALEGQDEGRRSRLDPHRLLDRLLASKVAVLGSLLAIAAALRLPGLEARGRFGGDQGVDLLVLRSFTQQGVIPLLGPHASVGDFHHGAFIYYLLAPSAWLSGDEPFAVVLEMALLGIGAVAATWWMGTVIGGPTVGAIAGLLLAVSPAAVDESIFIWNPNPTPLFAAIAAGAAWMAHRTGRGRWWILALGATGAVAQLHILGLSLFGPVGGLLLADLSSARRARARARFRSVGRGLLVGFAVVAILYIPLAISELQTGFAELRGIAAYVGGGGGAPTTGLLERIVIVAFRVLGWPFVGLVTDAPVAATLAVSVVLVLVAWQAILGRGSLGGAARWLGASILWWLVALAIAAPTLANVTPGLPNDHYHAFADPFVIVAVALASVSLARSASRAGVGARPHAAVRVVLAIGLVLAVGLALSRQPVPDPNGGWPAVRAGGARIVAITGTDGVDVRYLPVFEVPGDIRFGVVHAGGLVSSGGGSRYLLLGCDRLFESVLLASCGGQAEAEWLPRLAGGAGAASLVERFDLSPRVSISIYDLSPGP